ncbi:DUF6259 domain-containing protein [Victivallis sp. Marseille-Q1083]|uniref:DUF6259 domain-containing protein n=1 Tax=Victivallis sp. Marseille-Q1083 TaxID=2717288 RepID=UPI0015892100|nr:DUF6259 domain-containing protein [Victivallis sp. Marseille-Q1083]
MTVLENQQERIVFDSGTGAVAALELAGFALLKPQEVLFELGFRDNRNELKILSSLDFALTAEDLPSGVELTFAGQRSYPALRVTMTVRRLAGGGFGFHPVVAGIPDGLRLEWIDPVFLLLKDAGGQLFQPRQEGWLPRDPMNACYGKPDYPYYNHYPGYMPMQFTAYYYPEAGVYFAAHDFSHATKAIECVPTAGGPRLAFRLFCGSAGAADWYDGGFDFVVRLFRGDWMDACEIYRDWVEDDPALPPKGQFPAFVDDSPVCVLYPVQGHGADKGEMAPNEYFPYCNALPVVRRYAEAFDSRIMALLMHWEGTAPWAPPYVWPPLGGEALLGEYRDALHREGHLLGVYCSGTAWTQTSSINAYSRVEQCEQQGLERYMIRGPHGELRAHICNGEHEQRLGYDMCVSEPWVKRTLREEAVKLARFGIDYAQFFDQNLGGASHLCWAKHHAHPEVPGVWQTRNMAKLMGELNAAIRAEQCSMTLGCECAAAEPYLKYLPFSDLRFFCWMGRDGLSVPAYSYVFHEYVNNFMGNQGGTLQQLNAAENPDNLLYRLAYAFTAGDLLSVVLGSGGNIIWCWGISWDTALPEQQPAIDFIRHLTAFRRRHAKFLQYGRRLKTPAALDGERWSLKTFNAVYELDAFLHSAWRAPDGEEALVVANFQRHCQTIRLTPAAAALDGRSRPWELVLEPLQARLVRIVRK